MTTLTDRYVAEVLRGIPESQRDDIERELRSSIADAVEVRLRTDEDEEKAEVEALTALGDPARLSAEYAGRPLYLIGPGLYLSYTRLLKTLLTTAVPLVLVGASAAGFAGGGPVGQVLWDAAGTALTVAMHVAFWVTAVFAAVQRVPKARDRRLKRWVPAMLPELPAQRIDRLSLVGGTSVATVLICLLVLVQLYGPVPVISPGLWESGWLYLAVVFAAVRIGFDLVGYYLGWGVPQAVANAVMGLAFAVLGGWVTAGGLLLNDAFLTAMGWPEGVVVWVVVIAVVLMALNDSVNGFVRALRRRTA